MFESFYFFRRHSDTTNAMSADNKDGSENVQSIQVVDIQEEKPTSTLTLSSAGVPKEVPTVSTLLQRKKYSADSAPQTAPATFVNPESNPVTQTRERSKSTLSSTRAQNATGKHPPAFKHRLQLEVLNLDMLRKSLKKHRKSANMKKLDLLGYLATVFTEISYFEFSSKPAPELAGVLGFGNPQLASMVRGVQISSSQAPTLFQALQSGLVSLSPGAALGASINQLQAVGFKHSGCVGICPVMKQKKLLGLIPLSKKKELVGVWICTNIDMKQWGEADRLQFSKILENIVL